MIIKGKKYLITGGTGIIGYSLCERILNMGGLVLVLSRDENKLKKLKDKYNMIDIVVGDVCDKDIIKKTISKVSGVFHLAALAQGMQSGKSIESIQTNIIGSMNVLEESNNVDFVLGVSSDKAVKVSSVYGATKFLMEKLFNQFEKINPKTNYRVVRLGNVIYSVDSVLYKWKKLIKNCEDVTITDMNATRFFMDVDSAVDSILDCLCGCVDSKPHYKRMKSASMGNLLTSMLNKYSPKDCKSTINEIGLQSGENMHEKISEDLVSSDKVEQYTLKELGEII
jgi:FlaA1/EpsC-like NDP-sugar epimerase